MINVANIDKNNNRYHRTESEWNTLVRMTAKSKGHPCRLKLGLEMCLRGLSFLISKQLLSSCKRFVDVHSLALV